MKFVSKIAITIELILLLSVLHVSCNKFQFANADDNGKVNTEQEAENKQSPKPGENANKETTPDSNNKQAQVTKEENASTSPDVTKQKVYLEINNALNRGYSLLADQSSLIERPASCLGKYNIFDYEIDVEKMLKSHIFPTDVAVEIKEKSDKGQRVLKEYSVEEIKNVQEFVIKGNYKVPNSNYLFQRARSIRELFKKKTVLYFHDKEEMSVSITGKKEFPKLSQAFLADALLVFNKPEVKTYDNQEEFVREGLDFLYKYGTHYLTKTRWGSRMTMLTELKMKKADMQPSKTSKEETNIQSGAIGLEGSRDKKGERFTDFDYSIEIGNCHVDSNKNQFFDCLKGATNYGLIGYEVEYLYDLFKPRETDTPTKTPDGAVVTADKLQNIYNNLKNLINAVETALDARNSVINDLVIFNNIEDTDKAFISCIQNAKTKRFSKFPNSLFGDEHKADKLHPIFKLSPKDVIIDFDLSLVNYKKYSTYGCANKKFNLTPEDIFSPHLFNRRFINGVMFVNNSTMKAEDNKINPEDCTNFWVGKHGKKSEGVKYILEYLCFNTTSNFLDPELIVDVKVKFFNEENKCQNFKFNGREYKCLCDKNISEMPKKKLKTKRHLCYATKQLASIVNSKESESDSKNKANNNKNDSKIKTDAKSEIKTDTKTEIKTDKTTQPNQSTQSSSSQNKEPVPK